MSKIRNYLLLFIVHLVITSCAVLPAGSFDIGGLLAATDEPPGVGEKAERGYGACKPIIEALEVYKEAHGNYPTTLEELAPGLIAAVPTSAPSAEIWYEKTEASYRLNFTYIGPGMNICTFSPERGQEWKCSGAY